MEPTDDVDPRAEDAPLRYDIRLLGRILGDTVRAQEGEPVFALVEHIRRTAVQFHRTADEGARRELQAIMGDLPTDRALRETVAAAIDKHPWSSRWPINALAKRETCPGSGASGQAANWASTASRASATRSRALA
mgnify:CR=1 FL=1